METEDRGTSPNCVSLRDHGFSRPVLNAQTEHGMRHAHEARDIGGFEGAADRRGCGLGVGDDDLLEQAAARLTHAILTHRAEASAILNDLYNRQPVDEARMGRLLCLFRLDFDNPADMRPTLAGRPVWLAMAMDEQNRLRLKPQNLLMNLPLAALQ